MEKFNYPALLESNTQTLETVFGASETLYSCDTYQFTDYSRYDMNLSLTRRPNAPTAIRSSPSTSPTPAPSAPGLSKRQ